MHVFTRDRSMNENTRLGEIVEAVKDLEQAIIRDSGTSSECVMVYIEQLLY